MSAELTQLYRELNQRTRFEIPFRTIFFCGGEIRRDEETGGPRSLRDYLIRVRQLRLPARIIRAESAVQLYRETSYYDLISFEEDLARLSSLVLVISESPGSFAELGAFAVSPTIRKSLAIISQTKYENSESFIRFGPIENISKSFDDSVAFYPWETTSTGRLVSSSVRPHVLDMKRFIRSRVEEAATSSTLERSGDARAFYVIYWVLYLSYASSITRLQALVGSILPDLPAADLRNKLFCLKFMGWVDSQRYSNKEYFFALGESDPFHYRYSVRRVRADIAERRATIEAEVREQETLPRHIQRLVLTRRKEAR